MQKTHGISKIDIISNYLYSHHCKYNWEYCLLINDAWKFSHTIKLAGIKIDDSLNDFLIVECNTLEEAYLLRSFFKNDLSKISIWMRGGIVYNKVSNVNL